MNPSAFQPTSHQRVVLRTIFATKFGALSDSALATLEAQCEWQFCEGGAVLFERGDPGDCAYFVVSGRLRAVGTTAEGEVKVLGDIQSGETVGEAAVVSATSRSATVVAARDSVLVRIDADRLNDWFIQFPRLLLETTRLILKRGGSDQKKNRRDDHVKNIAFVCIGARLDMQEFKARLTGAIAPYGKCLVLDRDTVVRMDGDGSGAAMALWLDEQEAVHDFVLYIDRRDDSAWAALCLRRADRLVLLADPRDDSTPSAFEAGDIKAASQRLIANTYLALLHPQDTVAPRGTAPWLASRPWVSEAIHVRQGDAAHMGRLVRLLTGNAIGLVLGSGGARGLSQAGVFRALREAGIPIDRVGGTSIGAVMSAGIAGDLTADEVVRRTHESFGQNPTNLLDMSLPPLISFFSGKRLYRLLDAYFAPPLAVEDLWINYFCVSCDIASNSQVVHTRGQLRRAISASVALPGVFPPVRLGDGLHVDGAFMNALPVDVMGGLGVNKIIAIDLGNPRKRQLEFAETPSAFEFFYNKYFRRKKRKYSVPTMSAAILQSALLASEAKDRQARIDADLLFNPPVHNFGILAWASCGELIDIGYRHACDILEKHAATAGLMARTHAVPDSGGRQVALETL
nr:Cyclic nucleotide-binding domain [uncultured organism]